MIILMPIAEIVAVATAIVFNKFHSPTRSNTNNGDHSSENKKKNGKHDIVDKDDVTILKFIILRIIIYSCIELYC